jgi:hypothetical protein
LQPTSAANRAAEHRPAVARNDMVTPRAWWAVVAVLPLVAGDVFDQQASHPLVELLRPCVAIEAGDLARLDAGKTLVRVLSADDGNVAVFGARRVAADGNRLVAWMGRIEELRQGKFVDNMGRFSNPPSIDDLSRLSLDEDDLQILRDCTTGKCRAKITASEVDLLRREIQTAGPDWPAVVERTFRRIALERLQAYLAGGHRAIPQYVDGRTPTPLHAVFGSLLEQTPCLTGGFNDLIEYLDKFPGAPDQEYGTFFYWSKERLGGKPIVSATQAVAATDERSGLRATVVVSKQVFATHYMNGSLNVTAIVTTGSVHYLVVLNRTNVDFLRGFFGGFARLAVERRIKAELPAILDHLARKLESGPPPSPGRAAAWR